MTERADALITITFHPGEISIKGHAGYAEPGKDIVCAAISTLTQVFAASVEELTTDKLKCDMRDGNALIQYGNLTETAQTLLDSFFVGVQMIADEYPNNVQLHRPGVEVVKSNG